MPNNKPPLSNPPHYLKEELYSLVREDPAIFEFLQNGSLDGIWYWDLESPEHEWMSPRFWEVFGYEPDSKPHLAEAWQDMIDPDDLKTALENFTEHCEDPNHPYDQLVRYRHKSGSTVWVRCRGLAIRDEDGKPVRMLGAHTELTEQKQLEATLLDQRAELARSNAELEQFAYVASHDLQEPLRMVTSYLGLLKRRYGEKLDDDAQEFIGFAVDGAERMSTLIGDLLRYSRVGTSDDEFVPVPLSSVVDTACSQLDRLIQESGIEISSKSLPTVSGSETQLVQLFENLIGNATKYRGSEPPTVNISATCESEESIVKIQDNGIGFEMEFAKRVFQIFQRLHTREQHSGTGIGLAICSKIMERHRGRIWVESEPDKGSSFFVAFPVLSTSEG